MADTAPRARPLGARGSASGPVGDRIEPAGKRTIRAPAATGSSGDRPGNRARYGAAPSAPYSTPGNAGPRGGRVRPTKGGDRPQQRAPRVAAASGGRPRREASGTGAFAGSEPERIAKVMARAGLCSRRDAERWIAEARVKVNGRVIASPALDIAPGDTVVVDGRPLPQPEPVRLWKYHKPRGRMTTHKDPEGRPTVFDALPPEMPRVVSVGRLDFNTEGLLLLTTDGGLARHLELPATGWTRRYRVRAYGRVMQSQLDALKDGVEIEGVRYGPVEATIERDQGDNLWLDIALREGKNREVRKILGTLELEVNRLIRVSYGPFMLADLPPGAVEEVKTRVIAEQVGKKQAMALGLTAEAELVKGGRRANRPKPPPD